jgi:hypothetical protein
MGAIIDFFEGLLAQTDLRYLVFGDDEDFLAELRNEVEYPVLFVKVEGKSYEGEPDTDLQKVYSVYLSVLKPVEKGDYQGRLQVWKETELLMDQVLKPTIEAFDVDWTSVNVHWISGFSSSNLAGVWANLPLKVFQNTCL